MIIRVHHIGVAVKSLEETIPLYRDGLGIPVGKITGSEQDGVSIAFLPAGETLLELLESTVPGNGVARFVESRGEGIHHICLEVDDIEAHMEQLQAEGAMLLDKKPRRGAEGMVAFVHPKSMKGVLVELLQREGEQ